RAEGPRGGRRPRAHLDPLRPRALQHRGGSGLRDQPSRPRGAASARALTALRDGERRHRSQVRGLAAGLTEDSMAYSDKVIDHYSNPRNVGSFPKGEENVGTGVVGAPECGVVMKIRLKISDVGVVLDPTYYTSGCGRAIA